MNTSIEVKNGNLDILTQGLFFVNSKETTTLKLMVDLEELNIIIKFEDSEKDTVKAKRKGNAIDNTTLEVIFTNYNNAIGNYTKEFWKIGSIAKRNLYWGYAIYGFAEGGIKKVEYTFYLGEEANNG